MTGTYTLPVRSYNYNSIPTHTHDCKKCKFLFGIVFYDDHERVATVDVYEQCDGVGPDKQYLLRHSSESSDYVSQVSLKLLAAGFFESRKPNLGR